MGTSVGVGHSTNRNPAAAGKEAVRKALEQAAVATPDFVLVFATVGYDQQQLIDSIRQATAGAPLCGCSGEGVVTAETSTESNFAVCLMAFASDEIRFDAARVLDIEGKAGEAGIRLAEQLKPLVAPDTGACFLFADGLVFNFDPFLAAFEATLGRERPLPIFGGLAADNWALQTTYQYCNDEVFCGGVVSFLMSGRLEIASEIHHGCVPVGARRTITRCDGNIIREIDGMPALDALADYLDADWRTQWNKSSLNLCLGFKTPEHLRQGYEEHVVRYMAGKNEEEGYVTIQSEVVEGTELWILRRDRERIFSGVAATSCRLREKLGRRKPLFVFQFECVGRGKVVFRESEKGELISALQRDLGGGVPWVGFYTYGEIGPISTYNCFHNFTSVVAAVY